MPTIGQHWVVHIEIYWTLLKEGQCLSYRQSLLVFLSCALNKAESVTSNILIAYIWITGWKMLPLLDSHYYTLGMPYQQNILKLCHTANFWNLAYWKSDSYLLRHIFDPFNLMSTWSQFSWNKYIERFLCEICFDINCLSPNMTDIALVSWPLRKIYFPLLNY